MAGSVLLEVKDLHTDFASEDKNVHAVNGVSFSIMEGEIFGLIGESGCGKSVTCRSLIRLVKKPGKIVGGQIVYQGKNILECSDKEMQKIRGKEIGIIFQEPMTTLNPVLTIGQQLMESFKEPGMTKKEKKTHAAQMLRLVGIPSPEERLDSYAHEFSGGMRQRAMIAIALASRPHLLLADEPTTALDVTVQDQIIRLLLRLREELKMSMVLVTHDLGVASMMCDHIAVMYAGVIMESADAGTIFKRPANPYTYGLMRSIPSLEKKGGELYSIEGAPPDLDHMPEGCPFAPRCEFCEEICRKSMPELAETEPGHFTRCHRAECMGSLLADSFLADTVKGGTSDV